MTDSALNTIQSKIMDVFGGDTPSKYTRNYPGYTAKALFANQAARMSPIFNNSGRCIGQEVIWLKTNTLTADYNGDGSDDETNCAIADGQFPESDVVTYNDNVRIRKNVTVTDGLCNDLFNDAALSLDGQQRAATLIAHQMGDAIVAIRKALDARLITFVNANRTGVNNDANLPDYLTFNGTSDQFEADAALFQEPDFLTDIDALVANNGMMNYFMLSGRRNFYNAVVNSQYRRDNSDERDHARFDMADIWFDKRLLDAQLNTADGTTGQGYTFAIGEGTYALWNRVELPAIPTLIHAKDNIWGFYVEDPELMIRENGILRPVRYHVLYQEGCAGRQANGVPYGKHSFEVYFEGGLAVAPPDTDGHTGILKMVGIAGV